MWAFHSYPPQIVVRVITVGDFSHNLKGHFSVLASQKKCLKRGVTGSPFEHLESSANKLIHAMVTSFGLLMI